MSTAIAKNGQQQQALVLSSGQRAAQMAESLREQSEIRSVLKSYIDDHMEQGVDFGTIPGTPKPTLLQPGAEKLGELFRCTPEFSITHRVEDWDRNLFHYEFLCKLIQRDTGVCISEGVGSCNSREDRYRYRKSSRRCPQCGAEAIMRSKYPPRENPNAEPGWYCYDKKGGCKLQFDANDPEIVNQEHGKIENENVATQLNTLLKMAKKRAHVDASISLARRYGFQFDQDLDEMHGGGHQEVDQRNMILSRLLEEGGQHAQGGEKQLKSWWLASEHDRSRLTDLERQQLAERLHNVWKGVAVEADRKKSAAKPTPTPAPAPHQDEIAKERAEMGQPAGDVGDAWEPGADDSQPEAVSADTVTRITNAMAVLQRTWDAGTKEWAAKVIGRPIGDAETLDKLREPEGRKILMDLLKKVARAAQSAA